MIESKHSEKQIHTSVYSGRLLCNFKFIDTLTAKHIALIVVIKENGIYSVCL